jgi:Zn-dependent protease
MNLNTLLFVIAIIPAIILHEVAHGWMARLCGDDTAQRAGRLTLNPLRHIDPFGTVILPAILIFAGLPPFGYAKPVPINLNKLRRPRQQSLYVGIAGPATNVALSAFALLVAREMTWHVVATATTVRLFTLVTNFGVVNLCLAAFNMLPIPPLDGSALIERMVPSRHLATYFDLRSRAMPFLFLILIANAMVFHVGGDWLSSLSNWWLRLV